MAVVKVASFALEGLLKPLIFLTNCNDAARISSSVTGGSKLKSTLIFRHMAIGYRKLEQFTWGKLQAAGRPLPAMNEC